ncbi:MAG: glycosyltransferase family 4 protein [Anaerolineae bacterium]|nr:glycosyltransferase family 4 protein [Anaerolineae bacterium]
MIAPTSFFSDYGCSVRILEESRVLQRLGHDVMVCTYRNGQDLDGLCIRRTPSIPFREHYEVGSSPHKIAFDLLLFWTVLFAALRQRPDVIHAHMHEGALIGLLVGRLLRLPLVFDFQGSLTSEMTDHKFLDPDSVFFGPLRRLEETIDCHAPLILTSSLNAKELLVDEFGCHPPRVLTMPDCVDADAFYPAGSEERPALLERRRRLGIPPERKVVVYLGLLADYQGTDLLLQAAAQMLDEREDLHFLIMGFPSVERYQALAHELGISAHTTFTGKIPYGEARDHLALGDVAVAPKLSATEGSGKILNYMAMGLPTVAFDTPVSREYLGDLGTYAQPGNASSLAQALLSALCDGGPDGCGAALRRNALEAYTWDHAAEIILQAYERVCQPRARVI